jgi:hypothetical protein
VVDTGARPSGGRVLLANLIRSVQPEQRAIVVGIEKNRIEEPPNYDPAHEPAELP